MEADGTDGTCTAGHKSSVSHILTRNMDADYFRRAATATKNVWTFDVSAPGKSIENGFLVPSHNLIISNRLSILTDQNN